MEDQSAERVFPTERKQPLRFKKLSGTAGIEGHIFEYKFCALTYLKAKIDRLNFKLASNVKGFGVFDDVVVEYLDSSRRTSHICVQLKRKERHTITEQQLLAESGDFCLIKHYESYIELEKMFKSRQQCYETDGIIDECLFIIYTNADVEKKLKSDILTELGQEEFLNTGGNVLKFSEETHKDIYEHMKEKPRYIEFLSQYRIMYKQANEKKMDDYIIPLLEKQLKFHDWERESACEHFCRFIEEWWKMKRSSYFLQQTNLKENDPLQKTSEKLLERSVERKLVEWRSKFDNHSIKYKEPAIKDMKLLTETQKSVLIFAPGRSTRLTAAKIHQTLNDTSHIILNLNQLVLDKTEVMWAWKHKLDILVLDSQESSTENIEDIVNEISIFLNKCDVRKKFIFISSGIGNIQQTSAIRNTFSTNLTVMYDDWRFTDLVTESQMLFLEKKVYFQGDEIKLSKIVSKDDVGMLNALGSDSTSQLLENRKFSIGIPIKDTVEYYIDRTLQCNKEVQTRVPVQGEIKSALNKDILLEFQDISSNLENESERKPSPGVQPSTLLEVDGLVILVTDEPGMGKSTLLTHLAKQTRELQPDIWIVRVDINNYTRTLNEFKTNGCKQIGVIKLLTEAAKIRETDGLNLETRLFDNYCSSTGNMVVLIDGVDEVSPLYTEEVVQVLKILMKTKIKKIWVTSRNSVKNLLEKEFQCQSYYLVPFNEEDQKRFLVKFWKPSCLKVEEDYLDNLANQVVKLSTEQLNVEDKKFMGIPLQSLLLGEMFEGNLKEYSTSSTVELPEHINVVMLYKLYVEKKWGIYIQEKKGSDQTKVMVIDDDAELQTKFIKDHMVAALVELLSTQQLEKLTDRKIRKRANKFLKKISEGVEKTGIITGVIEGRPVFQHRTLAEYLVARWLCDNFKKGQIFMRDHLFESEFCVVRSMVDKILADKSSLHEAVLNCNMNQVEKLLQKNDYVTEEDRGGRTPLHVAVSCSSPELIQLLLEHGADVSSEDILLGLSPVQYAIEMANWEMLSLLMEKRPDVREQVLNGAIRDCTNNMACVRRAAAQYGHNDLLKFLIRKGNSVNVALPGDSSTLIHIAARCQQTETVRMLLLLGANIDSRDASGKTPLHVSVEIEKLDIIKCLVEHQKPVWRETDLQHIVKTERTLQRGNFLNVPDKDENTPLHLGVATGNIDVISYLVSAGSDLNTCNVQGDYPLTLAVRCGKNDIVELLLKCEVESEKAKFAALKAVIVDGDVDATALLLRLGVPVNIGENEKPIHVASRLGREKIFFLLLEYGASLTSRTDTGNTALHLASEAGHLNLVKYLVEEDRIGMCSRNFENETPLHLAARNGNVYIVRYFAENSCNVTDASANGATSLHFACENGHYTTAECLLKHGADVNAMNSANQTSLRIAASRGQTKIVELLFEHNATSSLQDKDGITALLAASMNGHHDTMLLILQHGGNIEDTDRNGNTIAHFAVHNENLEILNLLSQRNVSLDVQNSDGDTPLLQAVREGRDRIFQYLVEGNCDINTQARDGKRPLDFAVLNGNIETTRILLERNASSGNANVHIVAAARFGFLDLLQRFIARGDDINMKAENKESLLHEACKSGHVATVQYLCEHGRLQDWKDNNGNTAMHVAAQSGHKEICRVLLNSGASVNAEDKNRKTPLVLAAEIGGVETVRELLKDTAVKNLWTPLLSAVTEGHTEVVRELLKRGAAVNIANETGATPLSTAAEKGYVEIVTELLNYGASVDSSNTYGSTPLIIAATNGHVEVVTVLLNKGAKIDITDKFGRSPLTYAAAKGHVEVVRELLNREARVNSRDYRRRSSLSIAAAEGHAEVVKELLKRGAAVDSKDEYSSTPLRVAAAEGHVKVVTELLNSGATVDSTDFIERTPLSMAAVEGHVEVVRELLNRGATVDIRDVSLRTPLRVAAAKGHVKVVRELLNSGADVEIIDKDGRTPLSVAAAKGFLEIVTELLNRGATVDSTDNEKRTPLSVAAAEGHVEVVRELLDRGAALDSRDNENRTPLDVSTAKGHVHVEVIKELLNRGARLDSNMHTAAHLLAWQQRKDV